MRQMMKGNEAIAEAAVQAGCRYYFGYPITPQSEIPEYMSRRLPEVGGVFLQAESEIAAINMVYGAAGAGARAMTSPLPARASASSRRASATLPCAQLPCVVVNIVRGGPGLGSIQPAQGDYFQATQRRRPRRLPRGGASRPSSVQEAVDLTQRRPLTLRISTAYPVMILGDGMIGQMMEPVEMPEYKPRPAAGRRTGRRPAGMARAARARSINSLYIEAGPLRRAQPGAEKAI